MDDKAEFLPVSVLREPKSKLRYVNKESVEYLEMRDSIREHGILRSFLWPVEKCTRYRRSYRFICRGERA